MTLEPLPQLAKETLTGLIFVLVSIARPLLNRGLITHDELSTELANAADILLTKGLDDAGGATFVIETFAHALAHDIQQPRP